MTSDQITPPKAIRLRRGLIRLVYGALSLLTLLMAQGIVITATHSLAPGPYAFLGASSTAWKLASLGGYFGIVWSGGRSVRCVQWLLVGNLTWALADAWAPQDHGSSSLAASSHELVNALVFVLPWVLLAPERRQLFSLPRTPDLPVLGLAVVSAVPLLVWAHHNAGLAIPDVHWKGHTSSGLEARFDLVGLALVPLLVGLLAAFQGAWLRYVVGAACAYVGVAALVTDPADLGSPSRLGGAALLVLGVAYVVRPSYSLERSRAMSSA